MSRIQTEETKRKISESVKSWQEKLRITDPLGWLEYRKKQSDGTARRYQNREENKLKRINDTPFENLGEGYKREKVILDQKGACGKCKNTEWLGVKIPLEIDHINGNHQDDSRNNLIALCPNCHAVTPTWRGRNKSSTKRVTDEDAIESLKSSPSIRQALIKCGLAPKGGNYKRFTQLKQISIRGLARSGDAC